MLYLLGIALSIFTTSIQGSVFAKIAGTQPPATPSLVEVKTVGGDAITPTVDVANPTTGEVWTVNSQGETLKYKKVAAWKSLEKKSTVTDLISKHFHPASVQTSVTVKKNAK